MGRPAKSRFDNRPDLGLPLGRRGFLLVEATLTAVVIAIGAVIISRGIAGSLRAVSTIQRYDQLLRLAESTLQQREAEAQHGHLVSVLTGTFDPPDEGYQWSLIIEPAPVNVDTLAADGLRVITLQVSRVNTAASLISLQTLWPKEWVPGS